MNLNLSISPSLCHYPSLSLFLIIPLSISLPLFSPFSFLSFLSAAAGWPLSELWHKEIASVIGLDSILVGKSRTVPCHPCNLYQSSQFNFTSFHPSQSVLFCDVKLWTLFILLCVCVSWGCYRDWQNVQYALTLSFGV